jgi:hypothetical protein
MKLQKAPARKIEPTIALKDIKPGACVRFAHDTIEDAFKSDLFFMRLDAPEAKDRVRLVNLADGKQLERDGDHRVVVHTCTLNLDL